jgi:hypothetical protein
MTFLNPLLLFGLAAAAIPILIHLLNIRRLKLIDFSSLRFLKELQKTRMRRLKLRQWLILMLRTLLIVFLVLAFSRPALRGSLAALGGAHASSTVVILLDDSPSMGTRNDRGVLFDQAKEAVSQLLGMATKDDEVYLLLLSSLHDPPAAPLPVSPAAAIKALGGMTTTQRSAPYASLVAQGLQVLASSHNPNKEICLITDGQGTAFTLADTSALAGLPPAGDVGVFLTEISPSQRDNGAVSSFTLDSRLLSPQRPVLFRGTITNFGDHPIANTVASLYLDGTRVAQQTVTVAPHAAAGLTMSAIPKRRGIIQASLHIDDDAFDLDNNRYLVLRIPEHLAITCIGSSAADTYYPALALGAAADSTQDGVLDLQRTTRDRMQFTNLSARDVLILCSIGSLTNAEAARIVDAVTGGRNLVLFPANDTAYGQLNTTLLAPLGIPPISPPDLRQLASNRTGFASFATIDYTHPIFEGMFVQEHGKRGPPPAVESPRIRAAAGLHPGASGLPVITMSNGRPFLCEYNAGKGKVFIFAVESGTTWSDFPFKGLFAPLLHRLVTYLVSHHEPVDAATVGDRLRLSLRMTAEESGRSYRVVSPSGSEERVQPERHSASGIAVFQTQPSRETGIYALLPAEPGPHPGLPLQAVAVNLAAAESDLSRVEKEALTVFWRRMGIPEDRVHYVDAPKDIQRVVQESRYGIELWRYCLALALACALLEMLLGRASTSTVTTEPHADHGN